MNYGIRVFAFLPWIVYSSLAAAGEKPAPTDAAAVRASIERALPFVEEAGIEWIEQRECISCHRVGFMVWSHTLAAGRGFEIDQDKLKEWTDWSVDSLLKPQEMGRDKLVGDGNVEGIAQMILGVDSAYRSDRNGTYAKLIEVIAAQQSDDGTWKAGGQLPQQKRPKPETREVSTMWVSLALGESASNSPPAQQIRDKSMAALKSDSSAVSTEWYAVRTLLALQSDDSETVTRYRDHLIASQQDDGGWGWIQTDPSDALATGQALYALVESGLAPDHQSVASALDYLIRTQREDGSWSVKGTKTKFKESIEETSTYWGAAWAVIAMCSSLPEP